MDPACLRNAASTKCHTNIKTLNDPVPLPTGVHGPHTLLVRPLVRTVRRACHPEYCVPYRRLWAYQRKQLIP